MSETDTKPCTCLPFEPEPIEAMRARFLAAIEMPCNPLAMMAGEEIRPSQQRRHIFDWPDGLRMIVSVNHLQGSALLHASVSAQKDTPAARVMVQHFNGDVVQAVADLAQGLVTERLQSLAGWDLGPVRRAVLSAGCAVHALYGPPPEIPLAAAEVSSHGDQAK